MKFSKINITRPGSEEKFLLALQKTIHPSFEITKRDVVEMYSRTQKVLKCVSFKATRGQKILEITLMMNKGRICPITLSRLDADTFYGLRWRKKTSKIFLKDMDSIIPVLKEFLFHGIVNEKIFDKVEGRKGDDWPTETPRAPEIKLLARRYSLAVA
jgi:hypothetical protein